MINMLFPNTHIEHFLAKEKNKLIVLLLLLGIACTFFLLWQVQANWSFLLPYRGKKIFALLLTATAISTATIVFQTLTHNRILTPSIMGLDALYLLLQISAIAIFGGIGYSQLNPHWQFLAEVSLLMMSASLLFGFLLSFFQRDLYRLLLIGVIFGVLCQSLTSLFSRILSPEDYAVYQGVAFAQFNQIDTQLLGISTLLMCACLINIWLQRHALDIMALGRDHAISLGINYSTLLTNMMLSVAALVAISTALIGPVLFFGLLISALTYRIFPNSRHIILLPAGALIAAFILIAGQFVFERIFGFAATLSVVVELFGGLVFILLLLQGSKR